MCSPRVLLVCAVRPRLLYSCSDLRRLLSAPRLSRPLRSDADRSRPLTRHATVLELRARRRMMATQDLSLPMAFGGAVHQHPTTTARLLVPPRAGVAPRRPRLSHAPATLTPPWCGVTTTDPTSPLPYPLATLVRMSPGLRSFHSVVRLARTWARRALACVNCFLLHPRSSHCVARKASPCRISTSSKFFNTQIRTGQKIWEERCAALL